MHQQTITTNKKCTNTALTLIYNPMQYNHRIRKRTEGSLMLQISTFLSPRISHNTCCSPFTLAVGSFRHSHVQAHIRGSGRGHLS